MLAILLLNNQKLDSGYAFFQTTRHTYVPFTWKCMVCFVLLFMYCWDLYSCVLNNRETYTSLQKPESELTDRKQRHDPHNSHRDVNLSLNEKNNTDIGQSQAQSTGVPDNVTQVMKTPPPTPLRAFSQCTSYNRELLQVFSTTWLPKGSNISNV